MFPSPKAYLLILVSALVTQCAWGLILFSGDNDANQSDPGTGVPFDAVALMCTDGGGNIAGTAVHVKGKYMLTANHVDNRSFVTFDGVNYLPRDKNFEPVPIGTADLKLYKLIDDPGVSDVNLADNTVADMSYGPVDVIATIVGYGRGRSDLDTDGDTTWTWSTGDNAKRWGTNKVEGYLDLTDGGYTYRSLVTFLDASAGDNEVATAYTDSGSGLFVQDGGVWYLAGITTRVSTNGSSTFSDETPDWNYFVRIVDVRDAILAAIPDTTTLAGWLTDHGLYNENAASNADPDADGMTNIEEFAYGSDPTVPDASAMPTVASDETGTFLEYRLNEDARDISVTAQWADDLVSPSWTATGLSDSLVSTTDGIETRRATYSDPYSILFLHLSIEQL